MARKPEGWQTKKLTGAVDHWFHGDGAPGDEYLEDAKRYGIIVPEHEPDTYLVWPENHAAVEVFMDCQTQWRTTGAGVIGLDYSVVLAVANLRKDPDPLALLRDVQIMEIRARELINEQARQEANQ